MPCALLVHPVPKQLGVVVRLDPAERNAGHVRVPEDDVAMQVLAPAASGGELIADEGREVAGIVVPFGSLHDLLPGARDDVEIEQVVRFDEAPFPWQHFLEHGAAIRRRCGIPQGDREGMPADRRVRVVHLLEHAQIGRMVGNREKVERRFQAHLDAGRVRQRFSLGEPVGIVGIGAGAEDVGVERVLRMDVNVAEVGVADRPALLARRRVRATRCARFVWSLARAGDGQGEEDRSERHPGTRHDDLTMSGSGSPTTCTARSPRIPSTSR